VWDWLKRNQTPKTVSMTKDEHEMLCSTRLGMIMKRLDDVVMRLDRVEMRLDKLMDRGE